MKNNQLLDYEEYYTEEEEQVYDHGFEDGFKAAVFPAIIGIMVITIVALYTILFN